MNTEEIIKKFREELKLWRPVFYAGQITEEEWKEIADFISTTYPAYAKEFANGCLPEEKETLPISGKEEYDKNSGFNSAIVEMWTNIDKEIK